MEEFYRPLLNNMDLDPDGNYFSNLFKDSEYLAPSQITEKFVNLSPNFLIMHINCYSIISKLHDIQLLLLQLPISVLAVTETWLTDSMIDTIEIPNYNFLHKSREQGRGGRVGFCYKKKTFIIPNVTYLPI